MSTTKQARWFEEVSRGQEISQLIHLTIKRYRDYDKNQLKSSIDKPSVEEVSRMCRDCLKTVFQEVKNTDMNAIKHATQSNIQLTF